MTVPAIEHATSVDRDGRPAPRWAEIAAHLVTLTTLPSGLWRIAVGVGFSLGMLDQHGEPIGIVGWESVYLVSLSIVIEAIALLTLGLVRPWGERVPAWMPVLGGRRVAPRAVVATAGVGAVMLTVFITAGFLPQDGDVMPGIEATSDGWLVLFYACYGPLLLWGPLLASVTYAYYHRRCCD